MLKGPQGFCVACDPRIELGEASEDRCTISHAMPEFGLVLKDH